MCATCRRYLCDVVWRGDVAAGHGPGQGVLEQGTGRRPSLRLGIHSHPLSAADAKIVPVAPMSDRSGQRQCRRGVSGDVELDAAMALANMAATLPAVQGTHTQHGASREEEEELASTRLTLELGKVGIQASSCSSSSSAGCPSQQTRVAVAAPGGGGYGPRPRHTLTEAEKEAKRLRRVLANRESARQTILRRQAIRDELARKVADLSSQNESMKKVTAKTAEKAPPPVVTSMDTTPPAEQRAEATVSTAAPLDAPRAPGFLYTTAGPSAVRVPYVWGSWPYNPNANNPGGAASTAHAPPLCLPPFAWYYPVVTDPHGSPATSYAQPLHETTSGGGSQGTGGGTAEEDIDDDSCSLTLGLDVDRKCATSADNGSSRAVAGDRERAVMAAEARKRRKELTKLKQTHLGGRPGDE
ncbi:G-box-binding factor 3 [Hordeum vulgare]|nr:G-box-binding factor 3 [Hordeum vulgare]